MNPFKGRNIRIGYIALNYIFTKRSLSSNARLKDLLINMPKEAVHVPVLKKNRKAKKEILSRYPASLISLQVLGNGAVGAPRSLYVFTDQTRYLFNCGEGTQRLAHEHKMKLAKLEHIFITNNTWDNLGGLPGVSLTIQDIGVPEITLHGPPKVEKLYEGTKRFVVLKELKVKVADIASESFNDSSMQVTYVQLRPSVSDDGSDKSTSSEESLIEEDDTDYYAPIKGNKRNLEITQENPDQNKRTKVDSESPQQVPEGPSDIVMCYVCRPRKKEGTLLIEKCMEFGVPAGPLLGKLKSGQDVTLPNGNVVKAEAVRSPDCPGPVFLVVDCPDERYIDSIVNNSVLNHYHDPADSHDFPHVVAHFTPSHIMVHPKYKEWMGRFRITTKHIVLNDACVGLGSEACHRIQHKLSLLDEEMFPMLKEEGIELFYPATEEGDTNNVNVFKKPEKFQELDVPIIMASTLMRYTLRPQSELSATSSLIINKEKDIQEVLETEEFPTILETFKKNVASLEKTGDIYPELIFFGTGSSIPNKTRNTSAILVHTDPENCFLMDCAENTYGQIVRFYGPQKADEVLCKMRAVYISHLHADHHLGLVQIIRKRLDSQRKLNQTPSPVYLLAPYQIQTWLHLYNKSIEKIKGSYVLVPNQDLRFNAPTPIQEGVYTSEVKHSLALKDIQTTFVRHCPNAFGVAFTHSSGWKMTYSGDTMPCEELVLLGKDSDILIHEATMEDDLKKDAVIKMHSTTSEAIEIGNRMNAKFIMLTHFSQRYAKVPIINEKFVNNVGIAFDNMRVRRCDLPKIPLMYDALKVIFTDDVEEMERKSEKRLRRKEFEQMNSQPIEQKTYG